MDIPQHMIQNYLNRRLQELQSLDDALNMHNYPLVQKIGHQLKGNGGMFGFPAISEIGAQIENSAASLDHVRLQSLVSEYHQLIQSIQL